MTYRCLAYLFSWPT